VPFGLFWGFAEKISPNSRWITGGLSDGIGGHQCFETTVAMDFFLAGDGCDNMELINA